MIGNDLTKKVTCDEIYEIKGKKENNSLNKKGAVIIVGPASYLNPFIIEI